LVWRMNNALIQGFESDSANELVSATRDNNILTVAGTESDNVTARVINGQAAALYHDENRSGWIGNLFNEISRLFYGHAFSICGWIDIIHRTVYF